MPALVDEIERRRERAEHLPSFVRRERAERHQLRKRRQRRQLGHAKRRAELRVDAVVELFQREVSGKIARRGGRRAQRRDHVRPLRERWVVELERDLAIRCGERVVRDRHRRFPEHRANGVFAADDAARHELARAHGLRVEGGGVDAGAAGGARGSSNAAMRWLKRAEFLGFSPRPT